MDKLTMAHEYALKMLENLNPMQMEKPTRDGIVYECFELADAMQAEAYKREANTTIASHVESSEYYPHYEAGRDYPTDCYVMHNGKKTLAVSISNEWQPDWSQAPSRMNYYFMNRDGGEYWTVNKPDEPNMTEHVIDFRDCAGDCYAYASSQNYQGNWQESLRKRPQ